MNSYHPKKTAASNALTDLIRAVLRMSAHADRIGSTLTKGFDLSNARWVTLGELYMSPERMTVSQLARRLGLSRQAVQHLANELGSDGLLTFVDNPHDRRAMHLALTEQGQATYRATLEREWQWTNMVAEGFAAGDLQQAVLLIDAVTKKMADNA